MYAASNRTSSGDCLIESEGCDKHLFCGGMTSTSAQEKLLLERERTKSLKANNRYTASIENAYTVTHTSD